MQAVRQETIWRWALLPTRMVQPLVLHLHTDLGVEDQTHRLSPPILLLLKFVATHTLQCSTGVVSGIRDRTRESSHHHRLTPNLRSRGKPIIRTARFKEVYPEAASPAVPKWPLTESYT
jgi:hypothetical protein